MKRSERRDFLASIAGGCPPFERLDRAFEPVPGSLAIGRRRFADWLGRAAPSAELRPALIAATGLGAEEIERAFGPARPVEADTLPPWAGCLQSLLTKLPAEATSHDPDPTHAMAECLVPAAVALLDWRELASRHTYLSTAVLAHLTAQLSTRILLSCWSVLELEENLQDCVAWDLGVRAWLQRLSGFAGLSYILGTAIRQWRQNALEIIQSLDEDFDLLQGAFFGGRAPGRLVSLRCDCGDRHNDGRSVAILGFESGSRIVYKPKNLRCAEMLIRTMAAVDARTKACLPVRRILCRAHHTWEEYVEEKQARTAEEAARFFRNYGAVVRLLQFVEARDFWMDNLRVHGDQPVFVDLECILHPRLKARPEPSLAGGMTLNSYEESALPTAAVTHGITLTDGSVVQFGGLSPPGERKLPLGKWAGYKDRGNGSIWMKNGEIYWHPETVWPLVDGRQAGAEDFIGELECGYREVSEVLGELGAELVSDGGPLAHAGVTPVRVIMRSTWDYLHYLRGSLEVTALLDGTAREIELAGVVGQAPDWGSGDHLTRFRIALAEVSALRKLDVPEFHNLPSTSSILTAERKEIAGLFDGTGLDRLRQRAANPSGFDVAGQFAIIADAIHEIAA